MSEGKSKAGKADLLNDPIGATLKSMTVPVILGMIMLMSFSLVDTFFVSMLGTTQLAAMSFTFPVTFTVISLNIGLGIGTSATIARYLGAGEHQQAKSYGTGALILALLLVGSLAILGLFTITPIFLLLGATSEQLPYIRDYMLVWYSAGIFLSLPMVGNSILRASGDTKTPAIVMAMGGLINVLLDPLLIFGFGPIPAYGIQGAAIATLIAWAIGCIYILHLLAVKRQLIYSKWLGLEELIRVSKGILRIGLPAAGANMLTPVAGGIITAIIASYGTEPVAAWGVGSRLESIASIVVLALSMTLPPFISQNFGAGKMLRVEQAYSLTLKFILAWQFIVFVVMYLLAPFIASMFTSDQDVTLLIQMLLTIVPLGYGLQGVIILTNSSFNAMHRPMMALSLNVIRLFVFFVPASYIGGRLYQLEGLFWGGVLANLATAYISYLWFRKLLSDETAKGSRSTDNETQEGDPA